ncbi:MAG: ATP-binding cassette domain-containing protein [Ectothiorhodospiraceae bacterium AqS1]|nr:ATP-binding cassette domain-containing protein [Ectothiorhodospiraceae bacterium AqS1]
MIEIRKLTKRFGSLVAVNRISFDVSRGEVLGFLGPNGAGKSTTMKMVTGFLTPDEGSIVIDGTDIAKDPVSVKKRIGYLPEGAPLYGEMTPVAFLGFIAGIHGYRGARAKERVDSVIDRVSLESAAHKPIDTLSKGFKRRVGLAQAILHDPEILILDEPTDGLDPNQKHEVRTLIRSMAAEKVIILSTHILEEVDAVCTRATIIADGRIVSDDSPEDLLRRSKAHGALRIRLRSGGDPDRAKAMIAAFESLSGVSEVEEVENREGTVELSLFPAAGVVPTVAVADAARSGGWEVLEMYVERGRLDDVFREITTDIGPKKDRKKDAANRGGLDHG